MADFQGRSLWRRLVYSPLMVIVLALLILALARPAYRSLRQSLTVGEERDQVATQLAELEARREFLEQEIARLQTERGVEEEIRKKFPVVKEGERVIVVVGSTTVPSVPNVTRSWWRELFK